MAGVPPTIADSEIAVADIPSPVTLGSLAVLPLPEN
jgi:hypothetical protein